jgi:hypothetical protein
MPSKVPEYIRLFCKLDGDIRSEYCIHLTWTEIGNRLNETVSQPHCSQGRLIRSEEIHLRHFHILIYSSFFWLGIHSKANSEPAVRALGD